MVGLLSNAQKNIKQCTCFKLINTCMPSAICWLYDFPFAYLATLCVLLGQVMCNRVQDCADLPLASELILWYDTKRALRDKSHKACFTVVQLSIPVD